MNAQTQAEELRTEPIAPERIAALVPEIVQLLRGWGIDNVTVTYGYECKLPEDELWQPKKMRVEEVEAFINKSVAVGIFRFGECDLHIEDLDRTLEFRLCHESDVHFESVNAALVAQVAAHWHREGLTLYTSSGPKASGFPKRWARVDP